MVFDILNSKFSVDNNSWLFVLRYKLYLMKY